MAAGTQGQHSDSRVSFGTRNSPIPNPTFVPASTDVGSPATSPATTAPGTSEVRSAIPTHHATAMMESLQSFADRFRAMAKGCDTALIDHVHIFAKTMQRQVAKLGGFASPDSADGRQSVAPNHADRPSVAGRRSEANALDGYRPERDVVAPISVRPNAMELLWVCGDCGEHYPRARLCPEQCDACGAPKQHFYAPLED
ncbi:MAG: hypothetical protein NVSMB1_01990 [Polyangiales bacterium]